MGFRENIKINFKGILMVLYFLLSQNGKEHKFSDLEKVAAYLYPLIYQKIDLTDVVIILYYDGIPVEQLQIWFEDHLYFYNQDNMISARILNPKFAIFDKVLSEHNMITQINNACTQTNDKCMQMKIMKGVPKDTKDTKNTKNTKNTTEGVPEDTTEGVPEDTTEGVPEDTNDLKYQSIQKFRYDKNIYFHIMDDLVREQIKDEDINPQFSAKYELFRILDIRGQLHRDDRNIRKEWELFKDLLDHVDNISN